MKALNGMKDMIKIHSKSGKQNKIPFNNLYKKNTSDIL